MADWSPEKYLAFADERARPALDLIARLPNRAPLLVHDLGCGPGNSTRALAKAFPDARISAFDASPVMIATACASGVAAEFSVADVQSWSPDATADLVFSNALFQWVPQHDHHMLRIFSALKRGAVFAVQMPDNLNAPSHTLMSEVAASFCDKSVSDQIVKSRSSLLSSTGYVDLLSPAAASVEVWRTTYYHRLANHRAIAEMLSSTGLKPWLEAVDPLSRHEFLSRYVEAITQHYPACRDASVLYPFPRLFILAVRA